ncbi:uncharacterized protein LOC18426937 [Amborella trichopoda]|uniref:Myb/SANT-like domain-containing protein n=1 Tax=Amborella trichopoda TaxID=13333 RepID=W1NUA9_AMBTC|nr:uncharacterized protein LOC18426937 [Amborella trichopoda]ERM98913.1 hypothetical protein AMTR_s00114p00089730 [Amborella trichopoda]|eukprot:XP_006836060.1 uncharacterized protein LOC18426937 [Amborella trichopoda]
MESETAVPKRIEWKPYWDEFFVRLLVDQVTKGKKGEKGFSKESWRYMTNEFNKRFNQNLNKDQLKHRYGYYKREYKLVKMILDQSGFSWDETRKIVAADADAWNQCISEHPEAKPYQKKSLPLYEPLGVIFGDSPVDGVSMLALALPSPTTVADSPDVLHEESFGSRDEENAPIQSKKRQSVTSLTLGHSKRVRKGVGDVIAEALQNMVACARYRASMSTRNGAKPDMMKDIASAGNESRHDIMKDIVEELEAMEDLDDDLFLEACEKLKDEKNASIFMTLKGERRMKWVKKICGAQ